MRSRAAVSGAIFAVFVSLAGCGGVQYSVVAGGASSRLEEAKALGADQLAPYEYYFAKEHLEQAEIEAAAASYSDAVTLAHEAEEHAVAAIELTKKARRVNP
jgi:lipoprotein NlpI